MTNREAKRCAYRYARGVLRNFCESWDRQLESYESSDRALLTVAMDDLELLLWRGGQLSKRRRVQRELEVKDGDATTRRVS